MGTVIASTKWELPEGSSVTLRWLILSCVLSCGQGICAAHHRPEGQAVRATQHNTGLGLLS